MLSELCKELKNYFVQNKYFGEYKIENGTLIVPELQQDQYFRIVGSVFNDGVYQYPATELKDEVFDGAIWAMAIPAEVIALASEIDEWQQKYMTVDSTAMSPYNSESFGGYSYSKGGDADNGATWQSVFKSRLNLYRKIRP